jgi:hypothetical protein
MRTLILIFSVTILSAWIPKAGKAGDSVQGRTRSGGKGNIEIPCGKPSAAWNAYTPPVLYGGMVKCIEGNDYESAVYFFAAAGTFTYFDSLRVADESARTAQTLLLRKAVAELDQIKRDTLMDAIQRKLGNADELPNVCSEMWRVGAPQYYPRYIIHHESNADTGDHPETELVQDFDAKVGWKNAMNGYLHCPESTNK